MRETDSRPLLLRQPKASQQPGKKTLSLPPEVSVLCTTRVLWAEDSYSTLMGGKFCLRKPLRLSNPLEERVLLRFRKKVGPYFLAVVRVQLGTCMLKHGIFWSCVLSISASSASMNKP